MPTREEWIEEISKKNVSRDKFKHVNDGPKIIQGRK